MIERKMNDRRNRTMNDEQIRKSQKAWRDTFLASIILIAMDAVSRTLYDWAVPMLEGTLLIVIITLFYMTRMAKDHLMDPRFVNNKLIIPCYLLAAAANLFPCIDFLASGNSIVENGKAGTRFIPLLMFVFFGYQVIVLFHEQHKAKQKQ
jgi:hypothetical protein